MDSSLSDQRSESERKEKQDSECDVSGEVIWSRCVEMRFDAQKSF